MKRGASTLAELRDLRALLGLTGVSILPALPWRFVSEAGGWLADLFNLIAVGVVVVQSAFGSPEIGLAFAWLLVGVLTYQYSPRLYPGVSDTVVTARGFRGLMAAGVLFFGLKNWGALFGVLTDTTDPTVDGVVTVIGRGLVVWGVVFGMYVVWQHRETLVTQGGNLDAVLSRAFDKGSSTAGVSDDADYRAILNRLWVIVRWRELAILSATAASVCLVVGFTAAVLNLFYPLPEAVLFVGLGVLYVAPGASPSSAEKSRYEIDLRLVDAIAGATRNSKGFTMLLFSFLGMAVSGYLFSVLLSYVITFVRLHYENHGWTALPDIGLSSSLVLVGASGIYSLVHWVRQVERIEPSAREWETDRIEVTDAGSVTRPPWLLIPAHGPIVILTVNYFMSLEVDFVPFVAGGHLVAIIAMVWGLLAARVRTPQSLTQESRDLLLTLLIQSGVVFAFWYSQKYFLNGSIDPNFSLAALIVAIGVCLFYVPDGRKWAAERDGLRSLIGQVPAVGAGLLLIQVLSGYADTTLTVGVLKILLTAYVLYSVGETYVG
jgi:hypothetical protein